MPQQETGSSVTLKMLLKQKKLFELFEQLSGHVAITNCEGQLQYGHDDALSSPRAAIALFGEQLGWLHHADLADSYAEHLAAIAEVLAGQRRLSKELLDKYSEINAFYKIVDETKRAVTPNELARTAIEQIRRGIGDCQISVMLLHRETGLFDIIDAVGREATVKTVLKPGKGIAGSVFHSQQPELLDDVHQDPRYVPGGFDRRSLICLPLVVDKQSLGVINISREEPHGFTAADFNLAKSIGVFTSEMMENLELHAKDTHNQRIQSYARRYVGPKLMDAISEDPNSDLFTTRDQMITTLFADIRGFSTLCHDLEPEAMVGYLNEYFTQMSDVVFQMGGTLDKYVGDMLVAFFNAPKQMDDHRGCAVRTAVQMQRLCENFPNDWIREHFHVGIGIASGMAIVGNIGSPSHCDYTAIGRSVNLSARLQAHAEPGQILVTAEVAHSVRDQFDSESLGSVSLKGMGEPVEIFAVRYH